ncbi:MAG: Lnb N-terminal periplasmic domain-containing protein, partial [Archangium sp.]
MPRFAPLLTCLLGLLLLAATPAHAQEMPPWGTGESRGEDLAIYLVTFGPGDDVASWWGHGSLVVEDHRLQQARLYNYGMFSFDERMLLRYAMGRLEFWVDDASPGATFRFYRSMNRDVRLQELNLTPAQRVDLAKLLAVNVLPANRNYLYQHYSDNCVTRLRDGIDKVLGGQLHQAMSGPGRMTLREHTRRYTATGPAMSVLLDFLMNDEIDHPITRWQEGFLPDELERQVAELQVVGADGQKHPLVARNVTLYAAQGRPGTPAQPPKYGPVLLLMGLLLGGGAVGLAYWGRKGARFPRVLLGLEQLVLGLVLGLPGTALFIMWLVTDHTVT